MFVPMPIILSERMNYPPLGRVKPSRSRSQRVLHPFSLSLIARRRERATMPVVTQSVSAAPVRGSMRLDGTI